MIKIVFQRPCLNLKHLQPKLRGFSSLSHVMKITCSSMIGHSSDTNIVIFLKKYIFFQQYFQLSHLSPQFGCDFLWSFYSFPQSWVTNISLFIFIILMEIKKTLKKVHNNKEVEVLVRQSITAGNCYQAP